MPAVLFDNKNYPLREDESILECLLRNAQEIPILAKRALAKAV